MDTILAVARDDFKKTSPDAQAIAAELASQSAGLHPARPAQPSVDEVQPNNSGAASQYGLRSLARPRLSSACRSDSRIRDVRVRPFEVHDQPPVSTRCVGQRDVEVDAVGRALTSKGAAGVTGSGFNVLAATLSAERGIVRPCRGAGRGATPAWQRRVFRRRSGPRALRQNSRRMNAVFRFQPRFNPQGEPHD